MRVCCSRTVFLVLILLAVAGSRPFHGFPAPREIVTGDAAPGIILRDLNNKLVFCKNILREKPLLVSFFFTECVPCKKEIPELERLKVLYGGRVRFFMISTDRGGIDAVTPFVAAMNLTIEVLIDKYSDAARAYGVTKFPSTFIVGRDGKVVYDCRGYNNDNIRKIEEILKRIK